jgi:hypothetical protein
MGEYLDLARQVQAKSLPSPVCRGVVEAFCFDCIKRHGKEAKYQKHLVFESAEFPGWLELVCRNCGSKCYCRPEHVRGISSEEVRYHEAVPS